MRKKRGKKNQKESIANQATQMFKTRVKRKPVASRIRRARLPDQAPTSQKADLSQQQGMVTSTHLRAPLAGRSHQTSKVRTLRSLTAFTRNLTSIRTRPVSSLPGRETCPNLRCQKKSREKHRRHQPSARDLGQLRESQKVGLQI